MTTHLILEVVEQLNQLPPYHSSLQALAEAKITKSIMTLAEILEHQDVLMAAHENDSAELEKTERAVQKCLELPAVPLETHVPLGF